MLYEIAREIQARLDDRGYPLKIEYDERGFDVDIPTENIALIQYSDSGDDFSAPKGAGQNGRPIILASTGFQILICGVETKAGARPHEHKRVCTHNRNALLCELAVVLERRRNQWANMSGSFIRPEGTGALGESGAKYLLTGAIQIGISQPPVPTAVIEAISTTTTVKTPGFVDGIDECATPPLPDDP